MITKYLQKKILNHVFGASIYTAPVTLYAALFVGSPVDVDGALVPANEVTGLAYARVAITNDGTVFVALDADDNTVEGVMTNASAITFPTPTGLGGQ